MVIGKTGISSFNINEYDQDTICTKMYNSFEGKKSPGQSFIAYIFSLQSHTLIITSDSWGVSLLLIPNTWRHRLTLSMLSKQGSIHVILIKLFLSVWIE